jgi:hypothetical protein
MQVQLIEYTASGQSKPILSSFISGVHHDQLAAPACKQ